MWTSVSKANVGVLAGLDRVLSTLQASKPKLFPDLHDDDVLLVASDYSGHHQTATYEAFSFVFTTQRRWITWERHRLRIRGQFLLTRRISFKTLDDKKRWEVLPLFLGAAALLDALTISLLIDKTIGSLFATTGVLNRLHPELAPFSKWKSHSLEKMLRVTHVMALLLAGLSREGQDAIWISDEDEIAANEE